MPFWIDFCSIFDPNLPPKILPNRWKIDAKMPSYVELLFWSIFDRFWLPTSTPWTLKIIVFPKEKQGFFKKLRFDVGIDFWSILVPTCLHFSFQNPPKSFQKSIPRCIKFLIDFCIDFFSILAPTWKPSWSWQLFWLRGGTLWSATLFLVALLF